MIAALLILLGGFCGVPAAAEAVAALPALPAAAAPAGGIHERAADLWRRIRAASPSDPNTVGALQTEWNELKAIQREFGSDPDTHVIMRQAKEALATLNTGVAPTSAGPAAPAAPHFPVASPNAAQVLLNSAGGAATLDGGALFDGSLASGGSVAPEADANSDAGPGKAKKKKKKKKAGEEPEKPEKYHKHIWSTTYSDAALVILQKHSDSSVSIDHLNSMAEALAEKLKGRGLAVDWELIKKFRFKVVNDHFIIRLKYKSHMRTSIDLGDAQIWIPNYKRKHRKSKNKKTGLHASSPAGKRSRSASFAGRGGARRQTPPRGAAAKADKTAGAQRAARDAAQLAAARAAGARALKLAKATAAGLNGGLAAKPSAGAAGASGPAGAAAGRAFYSHGPGFDAEAFSYIAGPASRRLGVAAAADVASRGAGADGAPEVLRDAVAAGSSVGPAAAAVPRQNAGDAARAAAPATSAAAAFGGVRVVGGLLLLLLALAALAVERGASRRA